MQTSADPLAALLSGNSKPEPKAATPEEIRMQRIKALAPEAIINEGADLVAITSALINQQAKLINEIANLEGVEDASVHVQALRGLSIPDLQTRLGQLRSQTDPEQMTRGQLIAKIGAKLPQVTKEMFAARSDSDLRLAVGQILADEATKGHAVNPPEVKATTDPTLPAKIASSAPEMPLEDKTSRGLRFADGSLLSTVTVKSGLMQAELKRMGWPIPIGAGKAGRMRQLCQLALLGEDPGDLNSFGPFADSGPKVSGPPESADLTTEDLALKKKCIDEANDIIGDLDLDRPTIRMTDPTEVVVKELTDLRLIRDEAAKPQIDPRLIRDEAAKPQIDCPQVTHSVKVAQAGLFTLYVDCRPMFDSILDAITFALPFMAEIAKSAGVPHYLMCPYGEGSNRVAAAVAMNADKLAGAVYVNTASKTGALIAEALSPKASYIVKGDR